MEFRKLIRPHLQNLIPYSSARDEFSGSAEVYLDANENAFGSASDDKYRRYPDPYQVTLKKQIGKIKKVAPERIFLGNGSDEPIDLLIRAFCNPGKDRVIITPPTYGMYQVSADINDVGVVRVPLTADFEINLPGLIDAIEPGIKIIFLCSPNNPTGNSIPPHAILEVLSKFQGLVVLDEAYIDFSSEESLLSELETHTNLVILQTFSKAWGMAGLRLGMLFADPEIVSILNMIKPPYNINEATQELALEALKSVTSMRRMVKSILRERNELHGLLIDIPSVEKVYHSDANFLLVKIREAHDVYLKLIQQKVIVRDRSGVSLCEDCLRITVGTQEENQKLADALKKICS